MRIRMIIKWTAVLLVFMMTFSIAACADKEPEIPISGSQNNTETKDTDPTKPSADPVDPSKDPTENSTEESTESSEDPSTKPVDPTTNNTTNATVGGNPSTGYEFEITPLTGAVAQSGRVDASYFNDAVFVGDSVSLKLNYYATATGALGSAKFLTSGSMGSGNALWEVSSESVHPVYEGQKRLIEESIASMQAGKVYIMLGMNDIALYGLDGAVENLTTLIGRIKAEAPDAKIIVQTMTPMTPTSNLLSSSGHNPERIHTYNQKLMNACQANGWYFLDIASVMYDGYGFLRRDYCSDPDGMGIHFTNAGCAAWVEYLYTHAVQ